MAYDGFMGNRRHTFVNDYIYHVYNRGVEKRDLFLDDKDRIRFIFDLFALNNQDSFANISNYKDFSSLEDAFKFKPRKLFVDILAFTIMPNHYHLILRQKINNGIPRFMQKMGTS